MGFVDKILTKISFKSLKDVKQGRAVAQILKLVLNHEDSVFIDVGCHKGEVLKIALKVAPKGDHYAFEAIPDYYERLNTEFGNYVYLYNYAITNFIGETEFNFVESNPALSGIKQRDYPKHEKIQKLKLKTNTLDNALSEAKNIDIIRIDVEGAEHKVLDGAKRTIFKHKPYILFEHQQGAADYYNNGPDNMWEIIVNQLGMNINTLDGFLKKSKPFTAAQFRLLFETGQETYFIAFFG